MSDETADTAATPFSFADLDLLNAPDDPFAAPLGTWPGRLTEINVYPGKKDPGTRWLKFVWVHRGGAGRFDDLCQLPDGRDPEKDVTRRSRIKQRLLWLEVPVDNMDELKTDDLIGTMARVTTRKNGDFVNLMKLEVEYGDTSDTPEAAVDNYDFMGAFK